MSLTTIQQYLEYVEEYVHETMHQATQESLPIIQDALHRFSVDVSRFGFSMPEIPSLPSLGDFQVPAPAPPPPPPPPKSFWEKGTDWVQENKWKASIVGVVGVGLLVGYTVTAAKGRSGARLRGSRLAGASANVIRERREVVVVLGGDTPLALPLILDLEKKGYIVIASVASPEAADDLERRCNGYVRALILDPVEPATIPIFLRSLASTLSRRFPINASGDPHSSPATHPHIHSIISLLTLPLSSPTAPPPAPLEHLHLRSSYLPYLNATHLTPLQVIQALLPLLRSSPARTRDAGENKNKSIVVCIPAAESRIGLPFAAAHAMSAAATLRGIEVLRREINMSALTGDSQASMSGIKVVVIDVGAVDVPLTTTSRPLLTYNAPSQYAMDSWTPSEKLAYGNAYQSIFSDADGQGAAEGNNVYNVPRKPTDVSVFVKSVVDVVRTGGRRTWNMVLFGGMFGLGLGPVGAWISGERFTVGAGASTYAAASYLPTSALDIILNIPHFLISIRNALVYSPPRVAVPPRTASVPPPTTSSANAQPAPSPLPTTTTTSGPATSSTQSTGTSEKAATSSGSGSGSNSEQEHDVSETGSEADVESNAGEGMASVMGESWVSLKPGAGASAASSVSGDA